MKLKCIGGKCDGQLVWIDYRPRIGDSVRVDEPSVFRIEDMPSSYAEIIEKVATKMHVYTVDCLKYSHANDISEIWFLRPERFTTFDAIQFQFLK